MPGSENTSLKPRFMVFLPGTPASEMIRQFRIRSVMTQSEVASAAGVSVQTVKNWESGRSRPSKDKLGVLNRVLGLGCFERVKLRSQIRDERSNQGRRP